jgi:transcriptional antiterminator RfaH
MIRDVKMIRDVGREIRSTMQEDPAEQAVELCEAAVANSVGRNWYAVKCKPRQERIASANLDRAGIPVFFPQIKESKRIRQKLVLSAEPLFPGYLFARFDVRSEYRTVQYARGVHGIVSFGISPAVVDEDLILAIQERLHNSPSSASPFSTGQVVKIQSGPLHGMEAIFERQIPPYQRAVLLLRAISFRAKLIVDLDNIVNL